MNIVHIPWILPFFQYGTSIHLTAWALTWVSLQPPCPHCIFPNPPHAINKSSGSPSRIFSRSSPFIFISIATALIWATLSLRIIPGGSFTCLSVQIFWPCANKDLVKNANLIGSLPCLKYLYSFIVHLDYRFTYLHNLQLLLMVCPCLTLQFPLVSLILWFGQTFFQFLAWIQILQALGHAVL